MGTLPSEQNTHQTPTATTRIPEAVAESRASIIADMVAALVIALFAVAMGAWLWNHQNTRLAMQIAEIDAAGPAAAATATATGENPTAGPGSPVAVPSPIPREKELELRNNLLKTEFDGRGAIVQIGVVAGVLASLWLTFRNMRVSLENQRIAHLNQAVAQDNLRVLQENLRVTQDNHRVAAETLATTQKGQLTQRFTDAVEHLGAMFGEKANVELRLGGIYALAGLARDEASYRETIANILSAFVRRNAVASATPIYLPTATASPVATVSPAPTFRPP